jgi:tRNA G18 (ribose-2'-O)-methylase SpoU
MIDQQKMIKNNNSQAWNIQDKYKGLPLQEIYIKRQENVLPFSVCVINVLGELNLGSILRSAEIFGAERFFIYGKHSYDRRSTVGAHNYIEIIKAGSIDRNGSLEVDYSEFFPLMNKYGYEPIFIETGGKSFKDFDPKGSVALNKKPCFIFGNEGIGIDLSLMVGQKVFSIEQRGVLRSLNVSAAASIVMHHCANWPSSW